MTEKSSDRESWMPNSALAIIYMLCQCVNESSTNSFSFSCPQISKKIFQKVYFFSKCVSLFTTTIPTAFYALAALQSVSAAPSSPAPEVIAKSTAACCSREEFLGINISCTFQCGPTCSHTASCMCSQQCVDEWMSESFYQAGI